MGNIFCCCLTWGIDSDYDYEYIYEIRTTAGGTVYIDTSSNLSIVSVTSTTVSDYSKHNYISNQIDENLKLEDYDDTLPVVFKL